MSLESREYSQRLGVITPDQLQRALDRFGLGTLTDAQPVAGGLFGQNAFVTSSTGEWVLRGAPHYDGQFQKERFFSCLIHEQTLVEAPWPFLIERSTDVFGWHYSIMPRLPGVDPGSPDLQRDFTPSDRIAVARALGDHLGLLQSATFDTPAVYDYEQDSLASIDQPFSDWFITSVRDWLQRCRDDSRATTDEDVTWVEKIIDGASDALAVPFAPSLVHTDYKENNTCAIRTPDGWRITGVFDLGEAYIGDGEYDLARAACEYHLRRDDGSFRAFVDAYGAHRRPHAGFAERMRLFILLDRLIIWEYGQRNKIWFPPDMTLRAWAERFVMMKLE